MAENKKSFVLYADLIHTVEKMPDDKAGLLFKHLLEYVNDKNPETDDLVVELTFEPIKQQLKRDLEKWQGIKSIRSDCGKLGGRPKKQTKANKAKGFLEKQSKAKKAVSVSVSVNVINKEKIKEKSFIEPKQITEQFFKNKEFREKALISLAERNKINIDKLRAEIPSFISYWTERTQSGNKERWQEQKTFEVDRRITTWMRNNFGKKNSELDELYKKVKF